ncbi:MAG: glycosyltransferase family protein, partial [Gemmatimonadaceae bacterium]
MVSASGPAADDPWQPDTRVALAIALAIGALIRGWHVWGADFPLNDGGLFYAMVRDLQAAHYRLPEFTSYNGGQIPFGYSPLTLYLAGLLDDVTGVGLFTLFRVLPLVASTACIAALYPLARSMLPTRSSVALALVAFAIVPRGFVWLLMGGGLTRSFGYLFALLALHRIWLLYTRRSLRQVPLATLFSALTVLSHMGTAPFVAFSAVLLLLFRGRHREGVVGSMLVGAGTLLLTAPWWATVARMHGPGPFIAARATGGSVFSALAGGDGGGGMPDLVGMLGRVALGTTGEGRFPLIWILALAGMAWCIRRRRPLLPVWWAAIIVLDARAGFTYSSAPAAMLAGISGAAIVRTLLAPRRRDARWTVPRPAVATALGVLAVASIVAAASSRGFPGGETRD